jgi:integron integrase
MADDLLPEFQDFLKARKIVPDNQIPFYARWVSKFLSFLNRNTFTKTDIATDQFIVFLRDNQHAQEWQLRQAENAVRLYVGAFTAGSAMKILPEALLKPPGKAYDCPTAEQRIREAMRLRHYSYSTEKTYIDWCQRFYAWLADTGGSSTPVVHSGHIRDYLSHLAIHKKVSSSTQNQAFNALLFLCREVLDLELGDMDKTVRAKRGTRLPTVLTVEEMRGLIEAATGKDRLYVQLVYGTGMRLMEAVRLRVQDIDFEAGMVFIRGGKGDKDRSTMLPEAVKPDLRSHLAEVKRIHEQDLATGFGQVLLPDSLARKYPGAQKKWGWQWVFPSAKLSVDPRSGKTLRHHIDPSTIQKAVALAVRRSGIVKHASVHTLRHSFATHLLMNGVNIREVQDLLGHKNVETTMIYTHVMRDMTSAPKSPLDLLAGSST